MAKYRCPRGAEHTRRITVAVTPCGKLSPQKTPVHTDLTRQLFLAGKLYVALASWVEGLPPINALQPTGSSACG